MIQTMNGLTPYFTIISIATSVLIGINFALTIHACIKGKGRSSIPFLIMNILATGLVFTVCAVYVLLLDGMGQTAYNTFVSNSNAMLTIAFIGLALCVLQGCFLVAAKPLNALYDKIAARKANGRK